METNLKIKLLTEARDLLKEKGWCQGSYENSNGHYCVYGALRATTHFDWDLSEELAAELSSNLANPANTSDAVINWNDAPTRRKRDILRLFDRTIRNLEQRS